MKKGNIYSWGGGSQGCLGTGFLDDNKRPNKLTKELFQSKDKITFKDICCGSFHSMALTDSGDVYSWGSSSRGQLGHRSNNTELKPKKIDFFTEKKIQILIINSVKH